MTILCHIILLKKFKLGAVSFVTEWDSSCVDAATSLDVNEKRNTKKTSSLPGKQSEIFGYLQQKKTCPVGIMYQLLDVTRSGFYRFNKHN